MTPGEATLTIAAIQPTCLVTLAHHCCRSRMLSCVDGPIGNTAGQRPRRTWNLNSSIPFRIAGSGQTRDRRGISPPLLRTPAFSVAKKKKKKEHKMMLWTIASTVDVLKWASCGWAELTEDSAALAPHFRRREPTGAGS